jgi:hypothetical protein
MPARKPRTDQERDQCDDSYSPSWYAREEHGTVRVLILKNQRQKCNEADPSEQDASHSVHTTDCGTAIAARNRLMLNGTQLCEPSCCVHNHTQLGLAWFEIRIVLCCLTRLGFNPVSDAKLGVDSTVDA